MKNLITLLSALIFLSTAVHADNVKRNKKRNIHAVAPAPFVWGNPSDEVPTGLALGRDLKVMVPVAPFVWGNADEIPVLVEKNRVAVSPFVWGDPAEVLTVGTIVDAKQTLVPVAPFILGNPNDDIVLDLESALASQKKN